MSEGFKKDEKPYLVFPCGKCKQYCYVRSYKTNKICYRCGHRNKRKEIKKGVEVIGLTAASDTIRLKQKEIAKEKGANGFNVHSSFSLEIQQKNKGNINNDIEVGLMDSYTKRVFSEIKKFSHKNMWEIPVNFLTTKLKAHGVKIIHIKNAIAVLEKKGIIQLKKEKILISKERLRVDP